MALFESSAPGQLKFEYTAGACVNDRFGFKPDANKQWIQVSLGEQNSQKARTGVEENGVRQVQTHTIYFSRLVSLDGSSWGTFIPCMSTILGPRNRPGFTTFRVCGVHCLDIVDEEYGLGIQRGGRSSHRFGVSGTTFLPLRLPRLDCQIDGTEQAIAVACLTKD